VGDVTGYTTPALSEDGHSWTVAAYDAVGNTSSYAITRTFSVDVTPPDPPTLLSPADTAVISDTTPMLVWAASPGAIGYQLALDGAITDVGDVTEYTTPVLAETGHSWTVAAYDVAGNLSSYADSWSFTIDLVGPAPPTLVSPTNGEVLSETTPLLDWNSVAGATQYQVQVDNNSNFFSPEIDVTTVFTDHTPASPLGDDTYYWRVRAKDMLGNWGGWSDAWEFEVQAVIEIHLFLPFVFTW